MTTTRQQSDDEAAIRALIADWSRAVERKDVAGIVAAYTPQTVLYDAIPPHRTVGADAIGAIWAQCFPYFPDRFRSVHDDLAVEVGGDLAFVHGLHRFVPEDPDHLFGATAMRVTACYRKIDGRWRVAHEHVSVPFDPLTAKAVFLAPDGSAKDASACAGGITEAGPIKVPSVTPHLVCAGAAQAIDFYVAAFGATELARLPGPGGKLMHACVEINGSPVMLVDEFPAMGALSPAALGGTPVTTHLSVPDVDAVTARAVAAGAKVVMPVADQFWGDRYGVIEDPFGHRWSIATPQRAVSMADVEEAMKSLPMDGPGCSAAA